MYLSMNDRRRYDWSVARDAIQARMAELRWTPVDLHRASGLSEKHIRTLLNGGDVTVPRNSTLWALCDALGWTTDSIDRILGGEEPVLAFVDDESGEVSRLEALAGRLAEIEAVATAGIEDLRGQQGEMAKFFRLHRQLADEVAGAVDRIAALESAVAELRQASRQVDTD